MENKMTSEELIKQREIKNNDRKTKITNITNLFMKELCSDKTFIKRMLSMLGKDKQDKATMMDVITYLNSKVEMFSTFLVSKHLDEKDLSITFTLGNAEAFYSILSIDDKGKVDYLKNVYALEDTINGRKIKNEPGTNMQSKLPNFNAVVTRECNVKYDQFAYIQEILKYKDSKIDEERYSLYFACPFANDYFSQEEIAEAKNKGIKVTVQDEYHYTYEV